MAITGVAIQSFSSSTLIDEYTGVKWWDEFGCRVHLHSLLIPKILDVIVMACVYRLFRGTVAV